MGSEMCIRDRFRPKGLILPKCLAIEAFADGETDGANRVSFYNGKVTKVKVGFSLPHDAWEELEKSEAWNKVLKFLQEKKEATLL